MFFFKNLNVNIWYFIFYLCIYFNWLANTCFPVLLEQTCCLILLILHSLVFFLHDLTQVSIRWRQKVLIGMIDGGGYMERDRRDLLNSPTHPHIFHLSLSLSHTKILFFSLSPSQAFTLGLGTFLCSIRIRGGIEEIMLRSICARDRELCFWSLSDQGLTSYSSVWVRAGHRTVNAQARTSPNDCVRLWRILYLYALHVIILFEDFKARNKSENKLSSLFGDFTSGIW